MRHTFINKYLISTLRRLHRLPHHLTPQTLLIALVLSPAYAYCSTRREVQASLLAPFQPLASSVLRPVVPPEQRTVVIGETPSTINFE